MNYTLVFIFLCFKNIIIATNLTVESLENAINYKEGNKQNTLQFNNQNNQMFILKKDSKNNFKSYRRNLNLNLNLKGNLKIDSNDYYYEKIEGNLTETNYYYVDVLFGTQKQQQTLIIDTGSYNTGIPCKETCYMCGSHSGNLYKSRSKINYKTRF